MSPHGMPAKAAPGTAELSFHRPLFWARLSLVLSAVVLALLLVLSTVHGGGGYWAIVVLFGACMFPTMRRLGDTRPSLELHPEGLLDRMTLDGAELFIAWEDIVDVEPGPFGVLRLRVRDPERHLEEVGPIRRLHLRGVRRSHGTPFLLPGNLRTPDGRAVGREEMEDLVTGRIDQKLREEIEEGRARPS